MYLYYRNTEFVYFEYVMKKIFIFILLVLAISSGKISAQGINFEHGTWQETLDKARAEGKLVFLDAYTSWCGPCKLLSRNTFPDSAVGVFFNQHFVCAKIDMEKGEGPKLAENFSVNVYPTLIFADASGNLVHRAVGYHLPEQLIELGKKAIDPSTQIGGLQKRYMGGDRNPDFLLLYLEALSTAYDPQAGPVANQYLATQTDYSVPSNMEMIARYSDDPKSAAFQYLVKNKTAFEKKYGIEFVATRIQSVFDQYLLLNPKMDWAQTETLVRSTFPEDADMKASLFKMSWYRNREDVPGFLSAASEHYEKYNCENADELNEIAWVFYKNTEDKTYLKKALKWAEKSVKIYESFYNLDTVASLQAKLGQKKSAIKSAQRAIELAKQAGEDYSQTQLLLDQLNK